MFRSLLFVPSHKIDFYHKARESDADVIILDLEDSVQPISQKSLARTIIRENIHILDNKIVYVRVNDRESGILFEDIIETIDLPIEGYVYPKSHTHLDVYFFDKFLDTIEYSKGISVGSKKVIPLIETTLAVANVDQIAASSSRLTGLAFGCEDYLMDLGGNHNVNELSLNYARNRIAVACKSYGITPIDTVHIKVHDLEDLDLNLRMALSVGMEAMLCLHPKEIPLVHKFFTPSKDDIDTSIEILKIAEQANSNYNGVVLVSGKFVGPPLVKKAKKILDRAKSFGLLDS